MKLVTCYKPAPLISKSPDFNFIIVKEALLA
jgi:hypothetical protein